MMSDAQTLGEAAQSIRSKNAGPFWITIDIVCGDAEAFMRIRDGLQNGDVAARLQCAEADLLRFDLSDLHAIKLSLPRPHVQGSRLDRDMHGAQLAVAMGGIALRESV